MTQIRQQRPELIDAKLIAKQKRAAGRSVRRHQLERDEKTGDGLSAQAAAYPVQRRTCASVQPDRVCFRAYEAAAGRQQYDQRKRDPWSRRHAGNHDRDNGKKGDERDGRRPDPTATRVQFSRQTRPCRELPSGRRPAPPWPPALGRRASSGPCTSPTAGRPRSPAAARTLSGPKHRLPTSARSASARAACRVRACRAGSASAGAKARHDPDPATTFPSTPATYIPWRASIIFLISAIALAGLRPFGQVWAQFMMVWQR